MNQYIQPQNHLPTMVSKTVPTGTDGDKEASINSTRMLNITAADQVGVMNLILDAELKQNSKLFVHDVRSSVEDRSERSSMMWASVRNAHKRSTYNKPIKEGRAL